MQRAENNHRWLSSKREMVTKTPFSYSCVGMFIGICEKGVLPEFARVGLKSENKQKTNKQAWHVKEREPFPFDCSWDIEGISVFTESSEVKISNQINSLLSFLS